MFTLANATIISDMTTDLAAYSTAAFTLVAAVIALKVALKWAKGITGRAS